jgi:hypothetical protein
MNKFTIKFRKLKVDFILGLLFISIFYHNPSSGQCTTNTYGKYPATNYTTLTCVGTPETIASDCYAGEYSVVNVTSGTTYTFSSSVATDYITISTGAAVGTAVAFGTGSVTWVSTLTGTVRFFLHTSSACGSSAINRSRIVACGIPSANDAGVTIIYSLGKLPLVFGNNHAVKALIRNNGSTTQTDLVVSLNISGSNTFTDTKIISSLATGAQQIVEFAPFTPTLTGSNVITVSVPSDDVNTNNSKTWNQDVTTNLFSYKNPGAANEAGGVGFTGATGDFVAGFTSASGSINEVKVDFASGGQPYKVAIWDATGTGGSPGTLLWESASLTSATGTAFITVPNIAVSGTFFVGVRQTGTTNVAFAYQTETPLRANNFFYTSPTGGTAWTDLSSSGSFRFSIEPQFFVPQAPNCPISPVPADAATNVNGGSVTNLSWASGGGGATNYNVYFGTSSTPPLVGNTTNTTYPVTLAPNTTYYWSVVANNTYGSSTGCSTYSFTTLTPVANDNATGAIGLTVNAGCTGAPYTTVNSSASPGEPFPSCSGTANSPVWFSFVAPANGAVRISTDAGTGATLTDTKIALFSAENAASYSTFNIIACDDDGGSSSSTSALANNSVLYASNLLSGTTYYIAVDKFASTTTDGTFCITVDALNSSMLSTTNTCSSTYQTPYSSGSVSYNQWVPLLDESSKLIAMVRNPAGGSVSTFSAMQNVNTGAIRHDQNNKYYLDRNFIISNATATNVDVRLFFLNSELATLAGSDPSATLNNLNVTHQAGSTCLSDFTDASGANNAIIANGSGNLGTISYIQFNTPSFSNFYLMAGLTPLPIELKSITAVNSGKINRIYWTTASESKGDYFELERSVDGIHFNFIARVTSNQTPSDYTYEDRNPVSGVNYYRLKMMGNDGKSGYSTVVNAKVSSDKKMTVEAFPNPTSKNVTIKVSGSGNGEVTLSDISGKIISKSKMIGSEIQIDMNMLANGFYLIHYVDENLNEMIKINKQ